jgi:hypothetical protein
VSAYGVLSSNLLSRQINADKDLSFKDFIGRASALACSRVPQATISVEPFISISQHEGKLHSTDFEVTLLNKTSLLSTFTVLRFERIR